MSLDLTDDMWTLYQVSRMAWWSQATSQVTWANVDPDLYRHIMASLAHDELSQKLFYILFRITT